VTPVRMTETALAVALCAALVVASPARAQGGPAQGATVPPPAAKPAQPATASKPALPAAQKPAQPAAAGPAAAQPAPAKAAAAAAAAPAAAPSQAPPPEAYSYNPEGRRDPFISLVSRGFEPAGGRRGDGLAGLMTGEIAIRGVLQAQGVYVAIVQGPDMKTYIVHANDRLVDGTVKSIGPQGLVILQEVNDPLSLIKQREVRRSLRATDEGK
jgi:hypothetical protein